MFAKTQLVSLVVLASAALGVTAAGAPPTLDDCIIDCSTKAAVIGKCSSL